MSEEQGMMKEAVLTYPEGFPQILKMSDAEFAQELRFLAAAKLFELGRLSSAKSAQLAGMGRVEFLYALAQIGAPAINLCDEQVDAEICAAKDISA
jgi:predicted HTH domain antitoxin